MGWQDRQYGGGGGLGAPGGGVGGGGFGGGGGGGMGGGLSIPTPGWRSMTTRLIIINVVVLFADALFLRTAHGIGATEVSPLVKWGAFSATEGVMGGQVWRFGTYMFLHAGLGHLFFNMIGLFFFGPMVEGHLGSRRFLGFYLMAGLGGALLYLILAALGWLVAAAGGDPGRVPFLLLSGPEAYLLGASGCVFGILFAAYRIAPNMQVLLFFIIPVPLKFIIILLGLMNLWNVINAGNNAGGSAAHLGGALAGWLVIRYAHWTNWADADFWDRLSPGNAKAKVDAKKQEHRARRAAGHQQEVDRILDKVHREGLASLTEKEKRILRAETEQKRGG